MENKILWINKHFYLQVFKGDLDIEFDHPDAYSFVEVTKEKVKQIIEFLKEYVGEG